MTGEQSIHEDCDCNAKKSVEAIQGAANKLDGQKYDANKLDSSGLHEAIEDKLPRSGAASNAELDLNANATCLDHMLKCTWLPIMLNEVFRCILAYPGSTSSEVFVGEAVPDVGPAATPAKVAFAGATKAFPAVGASAPPARVAFDGEVVTLLGAPPSTVGWADSANWPLP